MGGVLSLNLLWLLFVVWTKRTFTLVVALKKEEECCRLFLSCIDLIVRGGLVGLVGRGVDEVETRSREETVVVRTII